MKKFLFYYCFIISLFITISGIIASREIGQLLLQLLFLPVTVYFSYTVLVQIIDKKSTQKFNSKANKFGIILTVVIFILLLIGSLFSIINTSKIKPKVVKKSLNLTTSPSPKSNKVSSVTLKQEYKTDKINVRNQPSTTGSIIGRFDQSKTYQFVANKDGWTEIIFDDKTHGFVNNKYVEIKP